MATTMQQREHENNYERLWAQVKDFLAVDREIDRKIDRYFAKRKPKLKKILVRKK